MSSVRSSTRNTYVDAIRALAIVEVLLHHLDLFKHGAPRWLSGAFHAPVGVQLFLVLSGWLLGGQLFRELGRTAKLNVPRFWARRWLRTLPAYYTLLGLRVISGRNTPAQAAAMLVFAQNYVAPDAWIISWSLCVQEHVYLALPLVLLVVARRRRLGMLTGAGLLVLSPLLRWVLFDPSRSGGAYFATIEAPTHMRLDGVVLGVLLAGLSERAGPVWAWCRRNGTALAVGGVLTIAAIALGPWPFDPVKKDAVSALASGFGILGLSLGAAMLIPATVGARPSGRRWWNAPATWVADHAYVLYLLHTSIYAVVQPWSVRAKLPWPVTMAAMVAATLAAGWVLRTAVEKPALRARDRIFDRPPPARPATCAVPACEVPHRETERERAPALGPGEP